jgi:predicted mannosyl-3-phosphoglycerate phosphatase (HAD superfamily)
MTKDVLIAGAIHSEIVAPVARVAASVQRSETTTYHIVDKQCIHNFIGMFGSKATLNILNATMVAATLVIIRVFESHTCARTFQGAFNTVGYQSSPGDCDSASAAADRYPTQISG